MLSAEEVYFKKSNETCSLWACRPTFGQCNSGPLGIHGGQYPLVPNLRFRNQANFTADVRRSSPSTHVCGENERFPNRKEAQAQSAEATDNVHNQQTPVRFIG